MKKKIMAMCLVIAMAATAVIGGTLAYFTDTTDDVVNTFTVGNVEIELFESYVARANSEKHAANVPEGMYPERVPGQEYTDEQIKEGSEKYAEYLEIMSPIVPGEQINKMAYVENTGLNDAYVRVRVLIPHDMEQYLGWTECTTARVQGEWSRPAGYEKNYLKPDGKVEIDGINYDVITYICNEVLEPGQMTHYQVLDNIYLAAWTTEETVAHLDNSQFNVIFQADAIQADGFKDAASAFAAFDDADSTYGANGLINEDLYEFTWKAE